MGGFPFNPLLGHKTETGVFAALTVDTPSIIIPESAPKVLLAHWEADAPGTVDTDGDLLFPSVIKWRDKLNGYVLEQPSLGFSPSWISASTMVSERPVIGFSGAPEFLQGDAVLRDKLRGLTGISITLVIATGLPTPGTLHRQVYLGDGTPRVALSYSNLNADKFYAEGSTQPSDPYINITGGTTTYDGWATQTIRRDFLNSGLDVYWNGEPKIQAPSFGVPGVGTATVPEHFIIGAGVFGDAPTISHVYAIKLYTYKITDDTMNEDNVYGGARINA